MDKPAARQRTYLAIDLKSFYASVECMERGLDPLTTNLVVADPSRTEKTICLAVSPALKQYGVPGRPRLFEVNQILRQVNAERRRQAGDRPLYRQSTDARKLGCDPACAVDYIIAPPQMAKYMACSTRIYAIYLRYIAPEDIHVYSIDEVFMDVTAYLKAFGQDAHALARTMIREVLKETGITATAGIGTNLYLAKVAMDIVAKHMPADSDGVRIAALDERSYRERLWDHRPITDFWRVGRGSARKLEQAGITTMGEIARLSLAPEGRGEALLYRLFGINAELLIDHAWGWEPCTMADIKAYRPAVRSLGSGQVLSEPYPYERAALIVREMAECLSMDLAARDWVTDQLVLRIGYGVENLKDPAIRAGYTGPVKQDHFGRKVPRHAQGTTGLKGYTASTREIVQAAAGLFEKIADPCLLVHRVSLNAGHVRPRQEVAGRETARQLDMFTDYAESEAREKAAKQREAAERRMQAAILALRSRYGKNAVLKGMNLEKGATTRQRNGQIGGHKA